MVRQGILKERRGVVGLKEKSPIQRSSVSPREQGAGRGGWWKVSEKETGGGEDRKVITGSVSHPCRT